MADDLAPKDLLQLVNDWLKFAEAKNAALVAVSGILFPVYVSIFEKDILILKWYAALALIFLLIAAFISLVSFLPRLEPPKFLLKAIDETPKSANSLYFADIASLSEEAFESSYCKTFSREPPTITDKDLIAQIQVNSRITARKFALFSGALVCLIISIFTPISILALLIMKKNSEI